MEGEAALQGDLGRLIALRRAKAVSRFFMLVSGF
jgi:hypothetical protein